MTNPMTRTINMGSHAYCGLIFGIPVGLILEKFNIPSKYSDIGFHLILAFDE
jgi:hypothetical protein